MNFAKITNEYYSKWLGVSPGMMTTKGVLFIESSERDNQQTGYPHIFDVYAYVKNNLIIISYSRRLADKIEEIKKKVNSSMTAKEVVNAIEESFNVHLERHIKFYYDKLPGYIGNTKVVKLCHNDYPEYLKFYKTQNPNSKADDWLEEYFYDICKSGLAFGSFQDNKLVSVTDAPDMPYIKNKVQEVGINTLSEYRGKGYAKAVTLECIKSIIEKGKCPQWSCAATNTSSEKLAYSVGFRKLADVITISI